MYRPTSFGPCLMSSIEWLLFSWQAKAKEEKKLKAAQKAEAAKLQVNLSCCCCNFFIVKKKLIFMWSYVIKCLIFNFYVSPGRPKKHLRDQRKMKRSFGRKKPMKRILRTFLILWPLQERRNSLLVKWLRNIVLMLWRNRNTIFSLKLKSVENR